MKLNQEAQKVLLFLNSKNLNEENERKKNNNLKK